MTNFSNDTASKPTGSGMIRNAFEQAPQAMAIYGCEGELEWINQHCSSLFELSDVWQADAMLGKFPNALSAEQRDILAELKRLRLEFVLPEKGAGVNELSVGTNRIIGAEVRPVFSDAKEHEGYVATFHDLTQTRKDEELRHRLLIATDLGDKVLMLTNARGDIEYVNAAFIRSTGFSEKEVLGKNPRVFKSGLMHSEVYRRMWSSLERGEVWQGELLNRKKSGELFWEQVIITPVKPTHEGAMHYLAVKENITERKLLRGRLEMLQGVMRVMSSESGFEKAAPKLARIIAESLAAGWVELWVQEKEREDLWCIAVHVLGGTLNPPTSVPTTGARIKQGEDPRFAALDSLGHIRLNTAEARSVLAFPIRTEQGGAGVLILGDLVNTASVIPAIDLVCAQLGHFLQRTRMENEILRARDIAEAASRAKSAFLSNMSHELRTPLNAILSLAQLMANEQGLAAAQQRQVAAIERSGLELLALINAILDISRVVSTVSLHQTASEGGTRNQQWMDSVKRLLEEEVRCELPAQPVHRDATPAIKTGMISQTTSKLLLRIHDIAKRADIDSLNRAIDELAKQDASLAMSLRQHAELYDYEAILAMSAQAGDQPKPQEST